MAYYKINGQAGYGKTYNLIQEIKKKYSDECSLEDQSFLLVTPTNKAALVLNSRLREDGLPDLANTLHSSLYFWRSTGEIKEVRKVRKLDEKTGKFAADKNGKPIYYEEIEYVFEKTLKPGLGGKILYVDESSMVSSDVWYDVTSPEAKFAHIVTYGDERQLPPIEDYKTMKDIYKPFYRFWHLFQDPNRVTTLTENHRQQGALKDIVEDIEYRLFGKHPLPRDIPNNLLYEKNFSIGASSLNEESLLSLMLKADIIITPYNGVRQAVNLVMRRYRAKDQGLTYTLLPVVGDRIIFTESLKRDYVNKQGVLIRENVVAKNISAVVGKIHDLDLKNNLISMDVIDEMGEIHEKLVASLHPILGERKKAMAKGFPGINYGYAVTVHSSQGGSWPSVLYLDSYWPGDDGNKLRYVAITRASERLMIVTNMTKFNEEDDGSNRHILRKLEKYLS